MILKTDFRKKLWLEYSETTQHQMYYPIYDIYGILRKFWNLSTFILGCDTYSENKKKTFGIVSYGTMVYMELGPLLLTQAGSGKSDILA